MVNPFLKNYNFIPECPHGCFNGNFVDEEYAQNIIIIFLKRRKDKKNCISIVKLLIYSLTNL
jgi:hypothetical protein